MTEPKIKEVRVHWGGQGNVAIQSYGKESSGYSGNITRAYEVPSDWTADQIAIFELEIIAAIQEQLEPFLQAEHDHRMDAQDSNGHYT
jgi:hypothetical protein